MTDEEMSRLIELIRSRYAEIQAIHRSLHEQRQAFIGDDYLMLSVRDSLGYAKALQSLLTDTIVCLETGRAPEPMTMQ
jgi:hypothetical protein